jgi:hypothetical protein
MRPDEWAPKPTGGDCVDAEFGQEGNSGFVEGVARGDPDVRFYSFTPKDFDSTMELFLLDGGWKGSEFTFLSEGDQSAIRGDIKVLITVHRDGPAEILPSPDAPPEVTDRRGGLENWVLVIGHDRQNWLDVVLNEDRLDFRPDVPPHGGTDVIETQNE